jgi:hypothetical protein
MFPVFRTRDWSAGARHLQVPAPKRCLHVVEYSVHSVSPLAEEASSPYGATDRGRSSCPNQASHGSIRLASATRVRSNAPGRCSNCLKQRPTRLREYLSRLYSRYIRPYRTSIGADFFRSVYGTPAKLQLVSESHFRRAAGQFYAKGAGKILAGNDPADLRQS